MTVECGGIHCRGSRGSGKHYSAKKNTAATIVVRRTKNGKDVLQACNVPGAAVLFMKFDVALIFTADDEVTVDAEGVVVLFPLAAAGKSNGGTNRTEYSNAVAVVVLNIALLVV